MKLTKSKLKQIIKEELTAVSEAFDPDERATAAGLEQDIEARHHRGDPYEGDFGYFKDGPKGFGDYPWIQQALEDLKDEEYANKAQAINDLAQELGVTVRVEENLNEIDLLGSRSAKALEDIKRAYKKDLVEIHNTLQSAVKNNSAHQAAVNLLKTIASKLDLMR